MTFHEADSLSVLGFVLILGSVTAAVLSALKLAGAPRWVYPFLFAFSAIFAIAAGSGILLQHPLPFLPILMALIPLSAIGFAMSSAGSALAGKLSFAALIGFQSFRLPLELVLHHWARTGVIPETMTWSGQNWDIVTGVLAILCAPFANRSNVARWIFQILGFALLLNVIRVVIFSLPLPFAWPLENPLQLPFHLPYVLIAPLAVWPAFVGHLVLGRKLMLTRNKAA